MDTEPGAWWPALMVWGVVNAVNVLQATGFLLLGAMGVAMQKGMA